MVPRASVEACRFSIGLKAGGIPFSFVFSTSATAILLHDKTNMVNTNLKNWREHGYVVVHDILSPAELGELDLKINQLFDGVLKPELPFNGRVPEEFYTFWEPGMKERDDLPRRERVRLMSYMYQHHPYFRQFAAHPGIYDTVAQIFGGGVQVFADSAFMKPALHGIAAAPHQDTAFWAKIKPNAVNFWLAVDAATIENGCLWVLPGSHVEDLPHQADPVMKWFLTDEQAGGDRQIPIELPAGSAIFFDSGLIHRSYPNRSMHSRRSMTAVYVAEDVMHVEPWDQEHSFQLLDRSA